MPTIQCNSGQVPCPAGAATQIVAARAGRSELRLRVAGLGGMYLGATNAVSAGTGYNPQVGGADGVSGNGALEYTMPIESALYAFNGNSFPVTVQFMEIFSA